MIERLAEDHANARRPAEGLADLKGLFLAVKKARTNIVYIDIVSDIASNEAIKKLEVENVRVSAVGSHRLRAIIHYHIRCDDIDKTILKFGRLF